MKRIIAVLLSAMMLVSVFGMTVSAARSSIYAQYAGGRINISDAGHNLSLPDTSLWVDGTPVKVECFDNKNNIRSSGKFCANQYDESGANVVSWLVVRSGDGLNRGSVACYEASYNDAIITYRDNLGQSILYEDGAKTIFGAVSTDNTVAQLTAIYMIPNSPSQIFMYQNTVNMASGFTLDNLISMHGNFLVQGAVTK